MTSLWLLGRERIYVIIFVIFLEEAGVLMGVSKSTLYRMMKKHNLL